MRLADDRNAKKFSGKNGDRSKGNNPVGMNQVIAMRSQQSPNSGQGREIKEPHPENRNPLKAQKYPLA
jgi:hypothetical protein